MPKGVKKNKNYMGNPNLPSKGAEFDYASNPEWAKEIDKCRKNLLHFAENYFYILNLDEGRQKIKLFPAQKRVLKKMRDNRFFSLLASRQVGKSTIMTIYLLWLACFFNDQKILLVANKEATAMEIFQRVRMAYEMLPNWLKSPVDGEYGKTSMVLENGSKISISTTTGTAARGQSVSCLVLDEVAFIEPHLVNEFWASVFPIVSSSKKSKVFMCSTANGTGNLFHKIYTGAEKGENNWEFDKILWNEVPGRDEKWSNDVKKGLASMEAWNQEYECNFINSGTTSLDEDLYEYLKPMCREPIEVLKDGAYRIFEHPNPERIYVAGVDTSEGLGGDFSCIQILDITDPTDIIQVAEYYSNTTPVSQFSNILYEILGHWYYPLACVERNNQGGQVVDRLGIDRGYYGNVICWGAKLAGRKNQELLGMVVNRNTKIHAVANARYFYSDARAVTFSARESLDELFKDFQKLPNGSWAAISGKHDDRTMALIWALMILDNDICPQYFQIEERDDCGKIKAILPLDESFFKDRNHTSIYTNEEVQDIELSMVCPVSFGGNAQFGHRDGEIKGLMDEGWSFLGGAAPYYNPDQDMSLDAWSSYERYFG